MKRTAAVLVLVLLALQVLVPVLKASILPEKPSEPLGVYTFNVVNARDNDDNEGYGYVSVSSSISGKSGSKSGTWTIYAPYGGSMSIELAVVSSAGAQANGNGASVSAKRPSITVRCTLKSGSRSVTLSASVPSDSKSDSGNGYISVSTSKTSKDYGSLTVSPGKPARVSISCTYSYSSASASASASSPDPLTKAYAQANVGVTAGLSWTFSANPPPPQKYRLTISVSGNGTGITDPPPGTYQYNKGSSVTVEALPGENSSLLYWLLDGNIAGNGSQITVTMDRDHDLVAVFYTNGNGDNGGDGGDGGSDGGGQTNTTYIRVDSVRVLVYPTQGVDCSVYGTAGRLLLYEHFRTRLVVEASEYNSTGSGGRVPARLSLVVPDRGWYSFSRWPGPRLGNESYSASLLINSSGTHVFWLPLNCSESWRSLELGLWNFTILYSWENGDTSGSGVASAMVLVDGSGGGGGGGGGVGNGTGVELFWLPVGTDEFYLVAFYRWSDGELVLNRSYLLGWVEASGFSIGLWGGLWRDVAGNFTRPLYTSISEVLGFEPPENASISFARVHTWDVRLSGLGENATFRCLFQEKFPSVRVWVAELSTPVYALNWTSTRVWGRLKLVDWARVKPMEGWVALLVSDVSGSRYLWFPAKPFAEFDFTVEEPYEVWAIPVAYGRNAIYVSDKYRILLVKQPP